MLLETAAIVIIRSMLITKKTLTTILWIELAYNRLNRRPKMLIVDFVTLSCIIIPRRIDY